MEQKKLTFKEIEIKLVDLYNQRAHKETQLVNYSRDTSGMAKRNLPSILEDLEAINNQIDAIEDVLGTETVQKLRVQEHTVLVNLSHIRTTEAIALEITQTLV